ncbi:hypothetical protein I0C86_41070 [Plantactinospora sp. S1510]|uniref:Uncharacterized protein n=1 Tax=Plantactinospora alkalitolerans TaxID=2789879 RepID=A0ABS0H9U3_9ACTN|nr:hypothetical protein [Plantactinospora alkalitolerans]MBF9135244.1 hypothetical protein [Plantactinospora alkalitolerans]
MAQYVVMIVGPTETPTLLGPYRSEERAQGDADGWNKANPPSDEDGDERWHAKAWPVQPFSIDAD